MVLAVLSVYGYLTNFAMLPAATREQWKPLLGPDQFAEGVQLPRFGKPVRHRLFASGSHSLQET